VHALRHGSITGVSVKLGAPLAAGSVRVVVHVNGVATAAAAQVPPGESFAAATFDKDAIPLEPGASVELAASTDADQDPSPIALDAAVELES